MHPFVLVAAGGALGSLARYLLSGWVLQHTLAWRFPFGTFLVNVAGCLIIGVLGGLVVKHDFFTPESRLFLFTGICGGFTTFSAFGLETFYLLRSNQALVAGSYVLLSVAMGLLALGIGFSLIPHRL